MILSVGVLMRLESAPFARAVMTHSPRYAPNSERKETLMKTLCVASLLSILPIATLAQNIDSDVDFTKVDKAEFIEEMRVISAATWPAMMQLYVRLDASLEEFVPAFEWTDAHVESMGCTYDMLSDRGQLSDVNAIRDNMVQFLNVVETREDVSFMSLATDDELIELLSPQDGLHEASKECGGDELNMRTLQESGFMDAVSKLMLNNPDLMAE